MSLVLLRIDERLIHGQVVVGWGTRLRAEFYVVVDEEIALSDWEQEVWAAALDPSLSVEFMVPEEAIRRFSELEARKSRGILLTRDTATMRTLSEGGVLDGKQVNVGGVYDAPSRKRVLDYVYLSEGGHEDLRVIGQRAAVSAQALPTGRRVQLAGPADTAS